MSAIAYLNGAYVAEEQATVSILDRSVLFADSVYEVTAVVCGRLIDGDAHLARLDRSLGELRIRPPRPREEIRAVLERLVKENHIEEGKIYLQISRGAADRDFPFPAAAEPAMFAFARGLDVSADPLAARGMRVVTVPERRWRRRDIKTTMLLPAVLARQSAVDQGADDAWFVDGGKVTEGSASNAYIVRDGAVLTHPLTHEILPGCTRARVLRLAEAHGVPVREEPFSPEQAYAADEAFVTSATSFVTPVVEIDGRALGAGAPGPTTGQLRELYLEFARSGS